MNITGTSQKTLDRFNHMEQALRNAGIETEYGVVNDDRVVLTWKRTRNGHVIGRGNLYAFLSSRTGNLRFGGGDVSTYYECDQIRTYRDAWDAIDHAIEKAREINAMVW